MTWEQIAALDHRPSIMQAAEITAGRRALEQLGVVLSEVETEDDEEQE